jgi:asparagine synthase (glutamine-hydrolysing)
MYRVCGILGLWSKKKGNLEFIQQSLLQLRHRGPDDQQFWFDGSNGVALGHTRLSILDLSEAGRQPMLSDDKRYALVFNGEIYNHRDLRTELEFSGLNPCWRGESDTETLLAAITLWGLEKTLHKLNGMYAFALWDRAELRLSIARDRIGEKPVYYGRCGDSFVFASELKGLRGAPGWVPEVDRSALARYMRYNHVPTPHSIFKGVYKLAPGHYVTVEKHGESISEQICYWSLECYAGEPSSSGGSVETDCNALDALLGDSVRLRMTSDVPVGAFLSGGYDSTMVVAQMQARSMTPIKTFTVGIHHPEYDEAPYAAAIAKHLGTEHTGLYISQVDCMDVIPSLPRIYDEPFADSSQIPTLLVSRLARKSVSVVLGGDGGDELFGGYNRHTYGAKLWSILNLMPPKLRNAVFSATQEKSIAFATNLLRCIPALSDIPDLSGKLTKILGSMRSDSLNTFYDSLKTIWAEPNLVIGESRNEIIKLSDRATEIKDVATIMMMLDLKTYLPDDILTKLDRASMAVSLEARSPLLDHRLVQFAQSLPINLKIRGTHGKWIFRQVLHRYVPQKLVDRPKHGFGLPLGDWLRGPLRDWAESSLSESRLIDDGFFNPELVRRTWLAHKNKEGNFEHKIWCVLMFQSWIDNYRETDQA